MKVLAIIDMQKDFIDGALGTKEAIATDGLAGVLTGALTAGAGGVTAAVLCGLLVSFVTKPRAK